MGFATATLIGIAGGCQIEPPRQPLSSYAARAQCFRYCDQLCGDREQPFRVTLRAVQR